jgi:tetratricopeptide (TPR) repeat protein
MAQTQDRPTLVHASIYGLFALVTLASFIPGLRLWGIDHLSYYPIWMRLAALLLVGLSFVPQVAASLHRAATGAATWWKRRAHPVGLSLASIALTALACLWLARSSTELLGDSRMVARSFEVIFANPTGVRLQGVMDIVQNERLYPGAMMAYYGAAKLAADLFGIAAVDGIRALNCLLGALVIVAMLVFARRKSVSADLALWLYALVCFSGAMALFAGYVEFYPPLVFAASLYLLAAFRFLGTGRGLFLVGALFVLSVFMHVQGILLGPSLLFVLWRRVRPGSDPRAARRGFRGIMTVTVLVVAAGALVPSLRSHYLPLWAANDGIGALSPSHLLDMLNELLLVLPALPVVAAMLWSTRGHARRDARAKGGAPVSPRDASLASYFSFSLLVLVPSLIYLCLFRTEIGVARDWDLFSMVALGLLPLSYLAVVRAQQIGGWGHSLTRALVPAIVLTIVLGTAWIGINASWVRSSQRFERLLEFDPTHSGYARENLALLYHDKGDLARATRIMEEALKLEANDRHTVRLARFYAEAGRHGDALALAREAVARDPHFVEARVTLLQILETQSGFEEMYEVAKTGAAYSVNHTAFWYYLAESATALGRRQEAQQACQKVLTLNPGPEVQRRVQAMLAGLASPTPGRD